MHVKPATAVLDGTPHVAIGASDRLGEMIGKMERRIEDLRSQGRLTKQTLKAYFGDKRFEEIAESNAIEGSPLSAGETELAVLRGVTISGHDPSWSLDAVNLSRGLDYVVELAKDRQGPPIHLVQLCELHKCVLGGSPWGGRFRTLNVEISGSPHRPPRFEAVPAEMELWSRWSEDNRDAPPILRAIVLSVWLAHIHPFSDGNNRTSRAVMNLELIRGGLPSVIIRKKDRHRYYEALAESDTGGDLRSIAELILARAGHALDHLERTARAHQGYDREQMRILREIGRRVGIWNDAVRLFLSLVNDELEQRIGSLGTVAIKSYGEGLDTDDYQALCRNDSSGNSWLARIRLAIPGVGDREVLAWVGYRSSRPAALEGHRPGTRDSMVHPEPVRLSAVDRRGPGITRLRGAHPERSGRGPVDREDWSRRNSSLSAERCRAQGPRLRSSKVRDPGRDLVGSGGGKNRRRGTDGPSVRRPGSDEDADSGSGAVPGVRNAQEVPGPGEVAAGDERAGLFLRRPVPGSSWSGSRWRRGSSGRGSGRPAPRRAGPGRPGSRALPPARGRARSPRGTSGVSRQTAGGASPPKKCFQARRTRGGSRGRRVAWNRKRRVAAGSRRSRRFVVKT